MSEAQLLLSGAYTRTAVQRAWRGRRRPQPLGDQDERSGLDALRAEGLSPRRLGSAEDFAALHSAHPLVEAERVAAALSASFVAGRPGGELARLLWCLVAEIDSAAVRDAAQWLVTTGLHDPSCLPVAIAAAEALSGAEPEVSLWPAYQARLLAETSRQDEAVTLARARVAEERNPLAWALLIDALRRCGAGNEALRQARHATEDPVLGPVASGILSRWSHPRPLLPRIGPRNRPRPRDEPEPEPVAFSQISTTR